MGRKPKGERAMTGAERQRRHRQIYKEIHEHNKNRLWELADENALLHEGQFWGRTPEIVSYVNKLAKDTGRSPARTVREAIYLGLDVMMWLEPVPVGDPKHDAAVHEAGHAVAAFLVFKEMHLDPTKFMGETKLKRQGAGHVRFYLPQTFPPLQNLRITVAGAVAQAKIEGRSFEQVWNGHSGSGDRKMAKNLGNDDDVHHAAETVTEWFSDPSIWRGLYGLARRLPKIISPRDCWEIYDTEKDDPKKVIYLEGRKYLITAADP